MKTWLAALGVTLATVSPAHADTELVPGNPALTTDMLLKYEEFFEWVFEAQLTQDQQHRLEGHLTQLWKAQDEKEIRIALDNLRNRDDVAKMAVEERDMMRAQVQPQMVTELARDKAVLSRWALGVFENAHQALLPGRPPLTRQMTDAYAEWVAFAIHESLGGAAPAGDADYRDAMAKALMGAWKKMKPAQRETFTRVPLAWAALRQHWVTVLDPDKARLRALWRERFKAYPAKTDGGAPDAAAWAQAVAASPNAFDPSAVKGMLDLGLKYEAKSW